MITGTNKQDHSLVSMLRRSDRCFAKVWQKTSSFGEKISSRALRAKAPLCYSRIRSIASPDDTQRSSTNRESKSAQRDCKQLRKRRTSRKESVNSRVPYGQPDDPRSDVRTDKSAFALIERS